MGLSAPLLSSCLNVAFTLIYRHKAWNERQTFHSCWILHNFLALLILSGGRVGLNSAAAQIKTREQDSSSTTWRLWESQSHSRGWDISEAPPTPPQHPHPLHHHINLGSFINVPNKICLHTAKSILQQHYLQCENLLQFTPDLFAGFCYFFSFITLSDLTVAALI